MATFPANQFVQFPLFTRAVGPATDPFLLSVQDVHKHNTYFSLAFLGSISSAAKRSSRPTANLTNTTSRNLHVAYDPLDLNDLDFISIEHNE